MNLVNFARNHKKGESTFVENAAAVEAMIGYLKKDVLRNSRIDIELDTPLVSSGMIDSFTLVEVLLELEKITGRRIPAGRVSPPDMDTVRKMFEVAERVGTVRS